MKSKLDQTKSRCVSWTKVNLVVPLTTCCQSATLLHMLVGQQPAALDHQHQHPGVWPHVTSARLNLLNADGNIYGHYLDSQQGDTQQIYRSKLAATVVGVGVQLVGSSAFSSTQWLGLMITLTTMIWLWAPFWCLPVCQLLVQL